MGYKDKAKHRAWQRNRARYRKAILARYKRMKSCQECGYNKCSAALTFHHLRDKTARIASLALYSMKTLKAEIAKCIVLCANCHAERHALFS